MITATYNENIDKIIATTENGVDRALKMLAICVDGRDFDGIAFWSSSLKFWLDVAENVKPG